MDTPTLEWVLDRMHDLATDPDQEKSWDDLWCALHDEVKDELFATREQQKARVR